MGQEEEKTQKSNEKVEATEIKPQTAKWQPAELLYLGSNPNPGSNESFHEGFNVRIGQLLLVLPFSRRLPKLDQEF